MSYLKQQKTLGDDALRRLIYTPADVANYTMQMIDERIENKDKGLMFGVEDLDRHLLPATPGEFTLILGRSSNGKTAFMQAYARNIARQITTDNPDTKSVVAFVEWENDVTNVGFYDLAAMTGTDAAKVWRGQITDDEHEKLKLAAFKRSTLPIWLMGWSKKRRREYESLTMDVVHQALCEAERSWGIGIAAVFLDFLQAVDPIPGLERRLQIMMDTDRARQIGRDLGCPVFAGSQAGRRVDERDFKLPQIGDNEESSRLEQSADKVLSVWLPGRSEGIGKYIKELDMETTEDMFIVGIRKQRFGAAGHVIPLRFDAAHNTFSSWRQP